MERSDIRHIIPPGVNLSHIRTWDDYCRRLYTFSNFTREMREVVKGCDDCGRRVALEAHHPYYVDLGKYPAFNIFCENGNSIEMLCRLCHGIRTAQQKRDPQFTADMNCRDRYLQSAVRIWTDLYLLHGPHPKPEELTMIRYIVQPYEQRPSNNSPLLIRLAQMLPSLANDQSPTALG